MYQLTNPLRLHLHTYLVNDHAGRQRTDLLQNFQSVFFQGGAGLHDIHNDIGQLDNGTKFHRTVQLDDVYSLDRKSVV